jgi:hypothetical protein
VGDRYLAFLFLVLERLDGAGVVLQAEGDLTIVLHTLHHLPQIINLNHRIKEEHINENNEIKEILKKATSRGFINLTRIATMPDAQKPYPPTYRNLINIVSSSVNVTVTEK